MEWTSEQRSAVIAHAMDLATNVDQFRHVIILTMTTDGTLNVIQKLRDDASRIEHIGIYRLMCKDTEGQMLALWKDNDRPLREDEEDGD